MGAQEAPALQIALYPGIRVTGEVGTTYVIESKAEVGDDFWLTRGWIELTTPTPMWMDPVPTDSPRKVYRAVKVTKPVVQMIPNMVWLPPGRFTMGSPASEPVRFDSEGPQTVVTISRGFFLGKYEVTQGEYLAVMGSNPSYSSGDLSRPVEQVSWHEAVAYCAALTARERSAGRLPAGHVYRLPTEAEWEYACRAGSTTPFHYGNALRSGMANFHGRLEYPPCGNSDWYCENPGGTFLGRTTSVGSYAPNGWGLYDMHGNVSEWCQDWRALSLPGGSVTDPQGSAAGSYRVIRGGSWDFIAFSCRSAYRNGGDPTRRDSSIGFRVLLAPGQ